MISTDNLTVSFGEKVLFKNVDIKFNPGNCYGLIGANGCGKTTLLKILSGDIEHQKGTVNVSTHDRIAVLQQNHFAYDEFTALETVIMGHKKLYDIIKEREAIYAKPDFSDEDGIRVGDLEMEFTNLNGWEAESDVAKLLSGLNIKESVHTSLLKDLNGSEKVRVLLAQALFGNPEILLMDEPTNNLDIEAINWLEEFLYNFKNTVIVVSHDRHFLDKVCTHIADIDYGKIQMFTGNFTFWKEASSLALKQKKDSNKKMESKIVELKAFIARFSANASKAKQATSRQNLLDKITLEDIKPSTRQYPHINFTPQRQAGNDLLHVDSLTKSIEDNILFKDLKFTINRGDKVVFIGKNRIALTAFLKCLLGEDTHDSGTFKWGVTTSQASLPKENSKYFESELTLIDWLRQYSKEKEESFIRGFLGKMLFSGKEALKTVNVLSGGEKIRCMLSRMMMLGANVLVFDEPTNHLDLESISALNDAVANFKGTVLFTSHDHQFIESLADRVIEIGPAGFIDKEMTIDRYLSDPEIKQRRNEMYSVFNS